MVLLGIVLALLGWFLPQQMLLIIGVVLIIVGLCLWFIPVGGTTRRWY